MCVNIKKKKKKKNIYIYIYIYIYNYILFVLYNSFIDTLFAQLLNLLDALKNPLSP